MRPSETDTERLPTTVTEEEEDPVDTSNVKGSIIAQTLDPFARFQKTKEGLLICGICSGTFSIENFSLPYQSSVMDLRAGINTGTPSKDGVAIKRSPVDYSEEQLNCKACNPQHTDFHALAEDYRCLQEEMIRAQGGSTNAKGPPTCQ